MKNWINKAIALLDHSLTPIPQEINELDWKLELTPKNQKITQHLSAFANQPGGGFMIFGIEDKHGALVGINRTDAESIIERIVNISRESLTPEPHIDHAIDEYQETSLLFVYIKESSVKPVHLKNKSLEETYIRSGGTTRKAARQEVGSLMLNSKTLHYEEIRASKLLPETSVLKLLDFNTIFSLLAKPVPSTTKELMNILEEEKMIEGIDGMGYYITNFGALSAANNLKDFDELTRKSIRVIKYKGKTKQETEKEFPGSKGYAIGFEGLITFLKAMLPSNEIIKNALRKEVPVYPEIALREVIANALIHQDLTIKGASPMIEIFEDRIEISNPGKLLPSKKIDRLIRTTPESRNEILASSFRRYNICEERGSGLEKAVASIELFGLPPIKFTELENSFRVTIWAPRNFNEMSQTERIEATYQHAVLKYFAQEGLTNTSLRERFKMSERFRSQISRLIKDSLTKGLIKPKDEENTSVKFALYVPYWA